VSVKRKDGRRYYSDSLSCSLYNATPHCPIAGLFPNNRVGGGRSLPTVPTTATLPDVVAVGQRGYGCPSSRCASSTSSLHV